MLPLLLLGACLGVAPTTLAWIYLNQTSTALILSNNYVSFYLNKTDGIIHNVTFEGTNVLGFPVPNPPAGGGGDAVGPYVDIYIPPANSQYTPGSMNASLRLINGTDSAGTPWGALIMSQPNAQGVIGEFCRRPRSRQVPPSSSISSCEPTRPCSTPSPALPIATPPYHSLANLFSFAPSSGPTFRSTITSTPTSARPTTFTCLNQFPTRPSTLRLTSVSQRRSRTRLGILVTGQVCVYKISLSSGDPYVENVADYWTKYTMSEAYRNHTVHGLFADGSGTPGNVTYGAWTVFNTRDTYYGGPTYADLTVDGLMYNYVISELW